MFSGVVDKEPDKLRDKKKISVSSLFNNDWF